MPKEFIVAIELGSSKMTGIAGQKNLDGSITVLALVEEDSSSCIRKGVIYNIDKTCQCLTSIINKLQTTLKQDITKVYVGVGGRSIRSVKNVIVKDYPENTLITKDMIDVLDRYKDEIQPAIILIPGKSGSLGLGESALQSAVERAVGADIL